MVKIGIIGINKGNGHPYSYSSIINGFKLNYLKKYCPYKSIIQYLSISQNLPFKNAAISHICTQNLAISKKISIISNIQTIETNYKSLFGKVDCIILAKDDIENNHKIITYFIKKKIPIFVDKQLASNFLRLKNIITQINKQNNYLFFSGSCLKYSKKITEIKKVVKKQDIIRIEAFTKLNWIAYSQHVLDPINEYFNYKCKFEYQKSETKNRLKKKIFFKLNKKINLNINLDTNCKKIYMIFVLKNKKKYKITLDDYHYSFKKTLQKFIQMVKNNKMINDKENFFNLSRLVLQTSNDMKSKKYDR
jgi:hypothetical protein